MSFAFLEVSLETTLSQLGRIPAGRIVVSESGISTTDALIMMQAHDVKAFLIGEAFMRSPDPGVALSSLFTHA